MNKKVLGVVVALFAGGAFAQSGTQGNVTISGSIQSTVAISNATATYQAPGAGPAAVFNAVTSPTAFDIAWNLGDINLLTATDAAASGSSVRLLLTFQMRSNNSYTLQAENVPAAGSVLTPAEIGFCTKSIAPSTNTAKVLLPRADAPSLDCRTVSNGTYDAVNDIVTYPQNLSAITGAGPVTVLTGNQISTGGSVNSPNNYIAVGTEFALRPELFHAQGTFSHTVTFTSSTP